ncbi:MAG: glycosyltransferase family 4 protein [Polyangia bacterium]
MRIGVLTTSYPREPEDPAGHFVRGLCVHLLRCGHTVEVIAAGAPDRAPADRDCDDAGLRVRRLPSSLFYQGGAPDELAARPLAAWAAAASFSARLLFSAARRLRGCDALLSHWLVPCGVAAALCASGRPHVAIAHSSDIHLLRRLGRLDVVRWLGRRARLVYTSSSLVVPGAEGPVVPMGLDVAALAASDTERQAARRALGLQRPTVLALSRLVPVKGLDTLIRALQPLHARGLDADLVLAGDGPQRDELQALAAPLGNRVRLVGEVRGETKRLLLRGCDVLALPSRRLPDGRTESAPTVLLEALAAGCPVVASDVGGVAELLDGAGLLVPADAPDALGEALARLLASRPNANSDSDGDADGDAGVAARLRALGRARAAAFDWSRLAPRLLGPAFAATSPAADAAAPAAPPPAAAPGTVAPERQ